MNKTTSFITLLWHQLPTLSQRPHMSIKRSKKRSQIGKLVRGNELVRPMSLTDRTWSANDRRNTIGREQPRLGSH